MFSFLHPVCVCCKRLLHTKLISNDCTHTVLLLQKHALHFTQFIFLFTPPINSFFCLLSFKFSYFAPGRHSATALFSPLLGIADCVREPIHPSLLEVGGGGQSWRWCRCSVFFVAVEEEEGQDSESCGGRFSALSGQQLQHLLPLSGNHTGCYCSRQR